MNLLLAIPQFVLALSLVTMLASSDDVSSTRRIGVVIVGLGIVSIPILGRITRANTLSWSEREFVTAARAMGARSWRIMFRDVLPNVIPAMLSIALLGVGVAIIAEGGLSVFGVGVQLPTPSWGNIIAEARGQLRTAPHIVMFTSIVLFLTVLALNYLGDVISQRFEVRESVSCECSDCSRRGLRTAGPAPGSDPVLVVEDIVTSFSSGRGEVRAVDGVSLSTRTRADPRYRRRVGLGQVGAVPVDHGPVAVHCQP